MVEESANGTGSPAAESAPPASGGMPDWLRFPLVLAIVGSLSALSLGGLYALTKEKIEESKSAKVVGAFESILGVPKGKAKFEKTRDARGRDYYVLARAEGTKAYAAQVECPGSYNTGDKIELIVVLNADLKRVLGVRVVKSAETPGLGQRVKEPTAARSLVGIVAGRPAKERVVLKEGGALVARVERKETGSVTLVYPDGKRRTFMKDEVAEVTQAPFPPAFLDLLTGVAVEKAKLKSQGGVVDALTGATISSRAVMSGVAEAAKLLREALGKAE
ncbi:MAG: FMN-binding protein [Planctomycetota bacterium]|jgi:Na+-translocating ferredoxin:NAD+ oxidoreductase RnfG subunit